MIIIKEENDHKYNFYERIVTTQNNLFLCSKEIKKVNEINNNIINYNIQYNRQNNMRNIRHYNRQYSIQNNKQNIKQNNKQNIKQNNIQNKINLIITKINNNINKFNNIKYYKNYSKEKTKLKIIFNKRYKKIENITKKILYGGTQNKLLNKANDRRLKHHNTII